MGDWLGVDWTAVGAIATAAQVLLLLGALLYAKRQVDDSRRHEVSRRRQDLLDAACAIAFVELAGPVGDYQRAAEMLGRAERYVHSDLLPVDREELTRLVHEKLDAKGLAYAQALPILDRLLLAIEPIGGTSACRGAVLGLRDTMSPRTVATMIPLRNIDLTPFAGESDRVQQRWNSLLDEMKQLAKSAGVT